MNGVSFSDLEDMGNQKLCSRKQNQLRAEIQIGLDAAHRGDYAPLEIDALKKDLREKLKSK